MKALAIRIAIVVFSALLLHVPAMAREMVSAKGNLVNLRAGPGTGHPTVAKAERYELLRTREKRGDWVRVQSVDGPQGWVARKLLWGW